MRDSEGCFQKTIIDMAHAYGCKVAAIRRVRVQRKNGDVYFETPMQADGAGWLDLYIVNPDKGWHCVAELKIPPNTTTDEQKLWLQWHEKSGTPAFVWTPMDWIEIESVLKNGPESVK